MSCVPVSSSSESADERLVATKRKQTAMSTNNAKKKKRVTVVAVNKNGNKNLSNGEMLEIFMKRMDDLQESANFNSDMMDDIQKSLNRVLAENKDLKTVYRVKSKISVPDKPAAVVVQIDNNSVRASVFKQRKMLAKSKIIVREDLTQKTLSLLKAARNKFTSKNSWYVRGSVFVKCNNIVHRVTDQKHLDQLNSETIT